MNFRFAAFPQEIVLLLDGVAYIHQLQILCHESKIPRKVEVHVSADEKFSNPRAVHFKRLGCVLLSDCINCFLLIDFARRHFSLSDNKKTDFKARELKSVTLNEQCTVLRLVLHQCHINDLNLFSQVRLRGGWRSL